MTDIITAADPIVAHDRRPSFNVRPDYLTEAETYRVTAWRQFHEYTDGCYDRDERPDEQHKQELWDAAEAAEAWYSDCWDCWQAEQARALECTCTPVDVEACPACKAKIRARLREEIPFDAER